MPICSILRSSSFAILYMFWRNQCFGVWVAGLVVSFCTVLLSDECHQCV